MRRSLMIAGVALLGLAQPCLGQTRIYRWESGLCQYSVRYDPRKVDATALANTAGYLSTELAQLPFAPYVATPAAVGGLDPARFEAECEAAASRVRTASLLRIEGIEAFRDDLAAQFDDACRFGGAQMRGHSDPSALRRYTRASPHCDRYVDALEGKSDLTAAWRTTIRAQCETNGNPAKCRNEHETNGTGRDGEAWKRLFVTSFGWQNCATRYATFNGPERERSDAAGQRLFKALLKTYRVKESCEDP